MIAIIDYGMGNLRSVWKAFESVGHQALVTRDPAAITSAGHVVLPGVGAFGDCMANLERFDLVEPIRSAVQSGKPFLGICLGLQLLFTESEEFGAHKGLNIIPGQVKRFVPDPALKIPHMGWNQIDVERPCPSRVLTGILFIPTSSSRLIRWSQPRQPSTALHSSRPYGRTISWPVSSIRKKVNQWACV